MMDEIIFSIKLELKDYRSLNFSFLYGGRRGKIYIIVILTLSLICGYNLKYLFNFGMELKIFNLMLPLLIVIFIAINPVLIYFQTKNNFKSNKFLNAVQNYSFNENGFTVNSDSSNSVISWDNIFLVRENKNYLFIFIAKNNAFILPKKEIAKYVVKIKRLLFKNLDNKKLEIKKIGVIN
jgi:YcxB-like protein